MQKPSLSQFDTILDHFHSSAMHTQQLKLKAEMNKRKKCDSYWSIFFSAISKCVESPFYFGVNFSINLWTMFFRLYIEIEWRMSSEAQSSFLRLRNEMNILLSAIHYLLWYWKDKLLSLAIWELISSQYFWLYIFLILG